MVYMPKMITDSKKIDEILNRGTIAEILPSKQEFRKKLLSGERLRMYIGFDATAPTLHLGHAQNFMLMEKFRTLGHEVIILFGDFTARIGDPTGESATRRQISRKEVLENVKKWKSLIAPLMDFGNTTNPPSILYNHAWLSKLTFEDVVDLASNFTVQQMLERDMFQKRLKEEKPIHLHEFLYPLMQGYDSVAMDVDVEVCGTDQIFNALAGRTLLKRLKNKDKFVVALSLLANPKTGELMSKSKGTGVFLDVSPSDLYGQVMAQSDEMIEPIFVRVTNLPLEDIKKVIAAKNPRDAKMRLAFEIVKIFHGEKNAKKAEENFVRVIQHKEMPEEMPSVAAPASIISIIDALVISGCASSNSVARRLLEQKGIKVNGRIIEKEEKVSIPKEGVVIQKGKRHFVRIIKK